MRHFDTLQYVKRAVAAGIEQKAAEFHAEEMATVISETMVTKNHFDSEMKFTRQYIDTKLNDSEVRMTWRILSSITMLPF